MKLKRVVTTLVLLFAFSMATFGADKPPHDDNFISDSVERKSWRADPVVEGRRDPKWT